jgi:hypothetical protein
VYATCSEKLSLAHFGNALENLLIVILHKNIFIRVPCLVDCLCGLVLRVPGYRSRGQGSISLATRFYEK